MIEQSLDCYILPSVPMPLLLPKECVAGVVADPVINALSDAPANWMRGHVNWQTQRLPVLSYAQLQSPELDESKMAKPVLVVLNPIPHAARKTYSGLICFGEVSEITLEPNLEFADYPDEINRRYVDAVIKIDKKDFMVPKLAALGVAFSYF